MMMRYVHLVIITNVATWLPRTTFLKFYFDVDVKRHIKIN